MRFIANLLVGIMVLAAVLAVSPPAAEAASGDGIIINEIMFDPLDTEIDNEWVELYNNGAVTVNVLNWTMSDQDGDIDFLFPDIDFPAGGYALIHTGQGTNSTTFENGRAHFYMWKTVAIWSPTVDECLLSNATGATKDYVSYGQWSTSLDPAPADFSYEHVNVSADPGFTLALVDGQLMQSIPTPMEFNGHDIRPELLITEVYYDTWGENEYIKIYNPGQDPVNISHWQLVDTGSPAIFPGGTEIDPGQTLTIAQNSTNYKAELFDMPDLEFEDEDSTIPELWMMGTELKLENDGNELFLLNIFSSQIDAFVYGSSDYDGIGWDGEPAPDLRQGQIAKRHYDGEYADSNTSADWLSLRPYVLGQSDFSPETFSVDGQICVFSSPDSGFGVISDALDNATQSICINLYEFTNTRLCDRLLGAISRGVNVRLFMEGAPVGGMNETQLFIMRQITEAGGEVRILTSDPGNDIHSRYDYDHAKYAIIDNETLLIMSENWGWSGIPPTGWFGNRGWGAAIDDPALVDYFKTVFEDDWNPLRADSVLFDAGHEKWNDGNNWTKEGYDSEIHFQKCQITSSAQITPVLSPDTSLSNQTILGMLNSAQETVCVEQLYVYKHWGDKTTGSTEETPNVYLEAVIEAARRGCEVRILLDSTYYNIEASDPVDNDDTVAYVNEIALAEGLDMEAKLVNLAEHDFSKIHNKGLIADDKVLISSINWNLNSATENREAGIIIKNQEAADFFTGIFEYDWMDDTTPPLAQFSCNEEYQVNTTSSFSASASFDNVEIVNYTWLLDGQPFSWEKNITYNFTELGTCCLNLTVKDAWGNTGWAVHSFNITSEPASQVIEDDSDAVPDDDTNTTDDNQDATDNSTAQAMAILLLVPIFIFIAIVYVYRIKRR